MNIKKKILMKNSLRETGNRIYVNNLPFQFSQEEFEEAFKCFGPVKTCTVIVQDNGHGETINRGIGFLTFETKDAYTKCLNSTEPVIVKGRTLIINPAKPEGDWEERPQNNSQIKFGRNIKSRSFDQNNDYQENDTLYVANIPISVNDCKLRSAFMKFKPYELRVIENEETQTSFAFIRILDEQCRYDAIDQMDGFYLEGRNISVRMADALFSDV